MHIDAFKESIMPVNENQCNVDAHTCAKCTGDCCKSMGCHISPRDLKDLTRDGIIKFIEDSQCVSIDWWEGVPIVPTGQRGCYLRMRNKEKPINDPAWQGECLLLTETGCMLDYAHRPMGGRELIPSESGECKTNYSKEDCAKEWDVYHDILESAYYYFEARKAIGAEMVRAMVRMATKGLGNEQR